MAVNEEILSKLTVTGGLEYALHVEGRVFALEDVSVAKSKIPVRRPTIRGGVYFTDTTAYKVKATTDDLTILELLPKIMLGPNTEFKPVEIKTTLQEETKKREITLVSHLASTVNTKNRVELNMIVDKTES